MKTDDGIRLFKDSRSQRRRYDLPHGMTDYRRLRAFGIDGYYGFHCVDYWIAPLFLDGKPSPSESFWIVPGTYREDEL